MCGRQKEDEDREGVYLELGLKTLHIGQVLMACCTEPTGKHMASTKARG